VSTTDTRDWRPLIFLGVLMVHTLVVWWVIRAARSPASPSPLDEPLMILLLPHEARAPVDVSTSPRAASRRHSPSPAPAPNASPPSGNAATFAPQQPKIDWEQEAERAAHDAVAEAAKQEAYRNLSALTAEQLGWVKQNRLEPAEPGISWKYRRVEVTPGGFPIIHINDHCVAVPFLLMMVFCQIGHVEPRGDLFDHMRDPRKP
jgi:hypothetical protein